MLQAQSTENVSPGGLGASPDDGPQSSHVNNGGKRDTGGSCSELIGCCIGEGVSDGRTKSSVTRNSLCFKEDDNGFCEIKIVPGMRTIQALCGVRMTSPQGNSRGHYDIPGDHFHVSREAVPLARQDRVHKRSMVLPPNPRPTGLSRPLVSVPILPTSAFRAASSP